MAYDFLVDETKLEDLRQSVVDEALRVGDKLDDIYAVIDGIEISGSLTGEAYTTFNTTSNSYSEELRMIVSLLNSYAELLNKVKSSAVTLNEEIIRACTMG